MLALLQQPELHDGDRLSRDGFMRRWEQIPELKQAELIQGVVYLASPVSLAHGSYDAIFAFLFNGSVVIALGWSKV